MRALHGHRWLRSELYSIAGTTPAAELGQETTQVVGATHKQVERRDEVERKNGSGMHPGSFSLPYRPFIGRHQPPWSLHRLVHVIIHISSRKACQRCTREIVIFPPVYQRMTGI